MVRLSLYQASQVSAVGGTKGLGGWLRWARKEMQDFKIHVRRHTSQRSCACPKDIECLGD
jgi:hypothetical protein